MRRGAPKGNRNAIKHGLYASAFTTVEVNELAGALSDGLVDEIAMLRVCIRRLFLSYEQQSDLKDRLIMTEALGSAVLKLAHVVRTQKYITGDGVNQNDLIASAIAEVVKEQGW